MSKRREFLASDAATSAFSDECSELLEYKRSLSTLPTKVDVRNGGHGHGHKSDVEQRLLANAHTAALDDFMNFPLCKMRTNKPSPEHEDESTTQSRPAANKTDVPLQQNMTGKNATNSPGNDATTIPIPTAVTAGATNAGTTTINSTAREVAATTEPATLVSNTAISHQRTHRTGSAASGGGDDGDGGGGGGGCGASGNHAHTTTSSSRNCDEETDVIGDLIGHFGKWQFLMTMLLSLFQVPNTFHIASSVYQAANKDFWCMRPEQLKQMPVDMWRNLSNSQDNCFRTPIDWNQVPNATVQLLRQQPQLTSLMSSLTSSNVAAVNAPYTNDTNMNRIACTAWEYESKDNVGNTWSSEWDLVCDKEYLKNVAEMFFLLGVATGGIISGYLSDKFGRKTMLFISAVLQTIFGLALYFATTFEIYITLRALLGLVSVSVTYAGLILAIEYVDGKWRTIAGMYNLFPLPISYMLISGIAFLTQDYQKLQLCIGIPGIFLCFLWFVVPESPRWLLVKGRIDDVKRIVQAAADFNGRQLPENFGDMLKPPTQEEASSTDFMCLFRSRYLRCISICFLCIWFTMNLVYYGLVLNMSSFGGNVYLNTALAGLVEIPAIAIAMYIISKVGKKWLFCSTLLCAGVACCCAAITEGREELLSLKITFLMIGKFTISAGNTIMPVYTAELYPTAIRNVGVGACNVAAGLALILTPYLSLLNKIEGHLLMTLLTAWSLFGSFVVLFLPETMAQHSKKNPREAKC